MDTVLIVIQLIIAVALIGCVLMQRTAQDGGGLTGGSTTMGGLFTARGSANLLTRTTAILATAFMVMSLVLGIVSGQMHRAKSIAEQIEPIAQEQAPADNAAPAAPAKAEKAAPAKTDAKPKAAPAVPVAK